jgi:gamma-glutamylcyclotransferase (GGCT)/AIG2-like uncharacterized protein YtfP
VKHPAAEAGTLAQPRLGYVFIFGYGSNMCLGRLSCRVPSVDKVAVAELRGYRFAFHKKSESTSVNSISGKANSFKTNTITDRVIGVVFEVSEDEMPWLDEAEGRDRGYAREELTVTEIGGHRSFRAWTYVAEPSYIDDSLQPFSWYKRHVVEGARNFGLDTAYVAGIEALPSKEDRSLSRSSKELQFPCDRKLTSAERVELGCHTPAAPRSGT